MIKVRPKCDSDQCLSGAESKNLAMKLSWLAVFMLLVNQSIAQDFRFIVRVSHYTPPDINGAIDRCSGTVIAERHVLAPASCVTPVRNERSIVVRKFVGNLICKLNFDRKNCVNSLIF